MTQEANEPGQVEKDINDVFDDIFMSENKLLEENYTEGYELGLAKDNLEAFHFGYHQGAEIGAEIGYYNGLVESYLKHYAENDSGAKFESTLHQLQTLLLEFPKTNEPGKDFAESLAKIRSQYKKLCSIMKINGVLPEADKLSF